jgi:3D (Asp-Asp-Asp) domain-containing protein
MKLNRTITTHATRLTVIGAMALMASLSISAAKLGAASPVKMMGAKAEPQELLHEITAPAVASAPHVRQIMMEVTAYCPCTKCCGPKAQGITASGKHVSYNAGRFVAADTKQLPFGTKLLIPGYTTGATPVEVIDRGGAIKGNKLDLFFPTHQQALQWGRQHVMVTVIE